MKYLLMLFGLFFVTGCVEKTISLEEQFKAGGSTTYRDFFTIRDKTIPLPPGDWKIIGSGVKNDFFDVYLIKEYPNKKFEAVYVCVDTLQLNRENGYIVGDKVKKLGYHHVVENKNEDGQPQDWWFIDNVIVTMIPSESTAKNEVGEYFKANNIKFPNDVVAVWHRLTGAHPYKKRYLDVQYVYNPEIAGFSAGQKGDWKTSEWNAARVHEDPKKVDFINGLKEKHASIHEQIKGGFHTGK